MEDNNDEQKKNENDAAEDAQKKSGVKKSSSFKLSIKKKEKKPKTPKSKKKEPIVVIPYLNQMPNEVLGIIFTFMEAKELVSLCRVSSKWRQIADSPKLWARLVAKDFKIKINYSSQKDWRKVYEDTTKRLAPSNKTLKSKPNDCESYVSRALVYMELKHYQTALEDLTKALQLKAEKKNKNKDVSTGGLLMRRASVFRKLKQNDAAKMDADEAITLEPHNSSFYRIRGNWAREDGRFSDALEDFNLAVELEPEIAIYHFCRGLVFKEMKDYVQAIANLDRAIEIEPNNAEYYCSRGRLHSHRNSTDEALSDMNKAVELDASNSDYLHWRGRIRRDRQECVEAMADFEAAVKMTGDDIDYAWRGIMHSHLKRNKEALQDIDQAIKLAPSNSFHYQFRGIIYFGLERYEAAIADFSESIRLLPNWAGHYVWRAAVNYELEQWDNTANDLDKAVNLRPDEVSLFWRALLALQQRQIWQARTDLTAAIQAASRPVHSRIYFWDGIAKWLGEEHEEALKSWQEAYRLSVSEKKVSKHTEPARVWLLGPTIGDLVGVFNMGVNNNNNNNGNAPQVNITSIDPSTCVKEAKKLYEATFDGAYTIDNTKTENSHLDLLHRLFPKNSAIKEVARWFRKKRLAIYPETESNKKSSSSSSTGNAGEEIKDQNKSRTKDHRR